MGGDDLAEGAMLRRKRPTGRVVAFTLRLAYTLLIVMVLPFVVLKTALGGRRPTAADALYQKVIALWASSPEEAVALLRRTLDTLTAAGHPTAMQTVEISPFGRFDIADVAYVQETLVKCELALSHHEEAPPTRH